MYSVHQGPTEPVVYEEVHSQYTQPPEASTHKGHEKLSPIAQQLVRLSKTIKEQKDRDKMAAASDGWYAQAAVL
jgi:hypothetical protein